jgi:hypothetical protein
VDGDGQLKFDTLEGRRQMAVVVSPGMNPMLLGWPDAEHSTINVRTTAEVLVYLATALFLLPGDAQGHTMELLAESPEPDGLEEAIDDTLAQDAEAESCPLMADSFISVTISMMLPPLPLYV